MREIVKVGPANHLFIEATEAILDKYMAWVDKYGEENALERFDFNNRTFLQKLTDRVEAGHEPDLTERAMVAAIHYASLLITSGEL